ncbi:hypothetical protein [Enterococcus sp. CSURQ0835]|uniref:hypothetical protein n=1 Tax=Enterococcus sp. CSURQ0835 TaxID=2681394 RepID=UPI00135CD406|nr:hypothetical protein [Enterococcus sp. CSURQ0835]
MIQNIAILIGSSCSSVFMSRLAFLPTAVKACWFLTLSLIASTLFLHWISQTKKTTKPKLSR